MNEGLAEVRMFAGLDPTMDFKSVTLYCCTAQSEKSCVALLSGNEKIDGALEKASAVQSRTTRSDAVLEVADQHAQPRILI